MPPAAAAATTSHTVDATCIQKFCSDKFYFCISCDIYLRGHLRSIAREDDFLVFLVVGRFRDFLFGASFLLDS